MNEKIIPFCRACGTLMQAIHPDSSINFWCPKCKLCDWNRQDNNFAFDRQDDDKANTSDIFNLSDYWR
ncbi:hypothetical protein [Myxosarcina sp. GI1]|uniref:hypothetical protein n=1 Tax=Myxosarcina sp. GI1 TaxID=1541065 RepID=UPI000566DC4A|nr:hypothetical protein [Myxosarcina sp. GI1]